MTQIAQTGASRPTQKDAENCLSVGVLSQRAGFFVN
jgi:hypothetical protein